ITARKQAENESQLLQKLTMAISMSQNFRSALEIVLEEICKFTDWKLGEVWVPVSGSELLACSPAWYSSLTHSHQFREISERITFPKGVGFPGRVWHSQKPEWLWDIYNETELSFPRKFPSLEIGLRAALGIPIVDKGDVMAVMVFFMTKPKDADQNLVGVISAIATQLGSLMQRKRDEEEIHLMNREIALARDQALEASRAKSTFVANMSHELRTPLNAILGYSEMLQEDAHELGLTTLAQDLQKIHQAGRHLLELINDILDLSKIESGKMELKPEHFNVRDVIAEIVNTIHPLLTKNKNQIIVECPENIGSMYADVIRLRQTLFNLLGNACKFTQAGIIKLRVWQEFDIHGNFYFFEVSDTGIGIAPEVQQSLFQPFMQADGSTTRQYGGTGLGLAISQRLCNMMGGRISLSSELGIGSVFTICLPAKLERRHHRFVPQNLSPFSSKAFSSQALSNIINDHHHLMADLAMTQNAINGYDSNAFHSEILERNIRILFIDVNPVTHQIFAEHLSATKAFLYSAYSLDDAYQLILETEPQVIVINIYPLTTAIYQLLQNIDQNPKLGDVPLFSLAIDHQREVGYLTNINEWLILPTNSAAVHRMLGHYRASYLLAQGKTMTDLCTVLVLSHHEEVEEHLNPLFEADNCHGIRVSDGQEALSLLSVMRPNLLLIDFSTTNHDYWHLLHNLGKMKINGVDYHDLPLVGLLNTTQSELQEQLPPEEQGSNHVTSDGLNYHNLFKDLVSYLYKEVNIKKQG
ncbi:MAG: ATP-binding protein, partial [Pseudanabaena sp. ELA607]